MEQLIKIVDSTLRDGSHSVSHQYRVEDAVQIAAALDAARIDYVEVSHGDGLSGSTLQYGRSAEDEMVLIRECAAALENAGLAVLLLPGIGTIRDLEKARKLGASMVRVATHVTEADISMQHIKAAREMGMETVGFLMMSHMVSPEDLVEQAKKMEEYGAQAVYCTDSAGAMLPGQVAARIRALRDALRVPIGFHGHDNMGCAVGNSLAAADCGASLLDASLAGAGAGAGNTPTEQLVAALKKGGYRLDADLYGTIDAAEKVFKVIVPNPTSANGETLMLGYAGVYSSFLLHTYRAAEACGVDPREILVELGRKKIVGGQEDMIIETAHEIAEKSGRSV